MAAEFVFRQPFSAILVIKILPNLMLVLVFFIPQLSTAGWFTKVRRFNCVAENGFGLE